ncbi:MAG TPA: ACP S-malonyltransferase [Sulfurovum sp.]|jgi:[acyl-carrier-protein] S-malonyltransferase|nr:MAG: [acyl-carrier-protein] S-malonyltransferase [Sulfurovum sp. 35-42-20]OYZ26051.1 MAG: [acyl-carrier-protein] S-malonyltransferase [Sulfurovum sp. 16-42-52]OYZ50441.1 MAG: [acyl-carrier-protein] S-malonyltransferase [Sulfurovum sp. 24-42-9]OZA46014.1 MAG: [acyl-carrier-protein] S-malonyltransferase [Sulfurovum sp. 17-42-90]OZA60328.1 MAG: [acyl-carrier-protein] S-malonyltransferase [Sulfurovum sp. 39-42-12]HQR73353.1 ACP S-malonyltransferase [Sulfurovum sp.]
MSIKCAFIFPGQGSQATGMGKDFFENTDTAKEMFAQAKERTGIDFETLLFTENEELGKTEFTQPAILLVSAIANRLFVEQTGIVPTLTLGHSLGEFSALVASGALDAIDAVELVNLRGKLMAEACSKQEVGMLVCLGLDDAMVEGICQSQRESGKSVWAVNYNSDGQIVIAGIKKDLETLVDVLKEAKAKRAMLLNMSVASHCPLLDSATAPLAAKLQEVIKDDFIAPVISNVTAKPYNTKAEALELLPKQLVMPVLYKQSIKNSDDEVDCYIEFGHGKVLAGLNKSSATKPTFNVFDMASLEATIQALKEL